MAMLTPVIKLVVFRQSLRPHSAVAFLVEFLCFVLELLDNEKDLAKIFGIICACDTLVFTLLDLIQNLIEQEVKIQRCGRVFWLYTKDGSLYWHTLNAYLLMLCIVHVIGSAISYVSRRHYLVLLPLFAAGLELVPQEAYRVLGPDQEPRDCIEPLTGLQDYVGSDQESQHPLQGLQDYVGPNQESGDCIGPLTGLQDYVGSDIESQDPLQGLQDYVGPNQESGDCIGPIHRPLYGKDQGHQDHVGLDRESQDCFGPLQSPLDGIELEQEVVVHVEPHQLPLDDIDLHEGEIVQIGPESGP